MKKLTFAQINSRLRWISTQPKELQKSFLQRVNDRGFWQFVRFHTLSLN
jgi:hypothetical protein